MTLDDSIQGIRLRALELAKELGNVTEACEQLGIDADVDAADIGTAKGAASSADLVLTSEELASELEGLSIPVRVIDNFMDVDEIAAAISSAIEE